MGIVRITNKKQMYECLLAGKFGNFVRAWNSLADVEASGYRGHVSLRSKEVSNPVRLYHVPFADLRQTVETLPESQRLSGLVFSESPPDEKRTIQGELMRNHKGYVLTYSYVPKPMRLAFADQCLTATGLEAKMLLEHHLTPTDYDELQLLLDLYEDHVIEFSAFSVNVGVLPRRNCVIWEVRLY